MKVAIFGGSVLPEDGYEFIIVILEQFYEREKKGEVIEYRIPNDNNFSYELLKEYFSRNDIKTFKEYKPDWKVHGKNTHTERLKEMVSDFGPEDVVISIVDSVAKEAGLPKSGINYLLVKAAEGKGFTIQTHFVPSYKDITSFFGVHTFLSNFYLSPVYTHGRYYTNAEAAFQGCKTLDHEDAKRFEGLDPRQAKEYGRVVSLREDWEEVKEQMMYEVIKAKFLTIPTCNYAGTRLFRSLMATGDRKLIEGNYRHDNEWGYCYCKECKDIPKNNKLGSILMRVREELKAYNKLAIPFVSGTNSIDILKGILSYISSTDVLLSGKIDSIVLDNINILAADVQSHILDCKYIRKDQTIYAALEDGTPTMTVIMNICGENEPIEVLVGKDVVIRHANRNPHYKYVYSINIRPLGVMLWSSCDDIDDVEKNSSIILKELAEYVTSTKYLNESISSLYNGSGENPESDDGYSLLEIKIYTDKENN